MRRTIARRIERLETRAAPPVKSVWLEKDGEVITEWGTGRRLTAEEYAALCADPRTVVHYWVYV